MKESQILSVFGKATLRAPVSEVLHLTAEPKYITVRTASHSYLLETALSEMETRFASRFIRIHCHVLVARQAVRAPEKHAIPRRGPTARYGWTRWTTCYLWRADNSQRRGRGLITLTFRP